MTDREIQAGRPPLLNFRDPGGCLVPNGGRVRTGILYRSGDLGALDDAGVKAVAALGVRTVYDLRTDSEHAARPDRLPSHARLVRLDVLADGPPEGSPGHLMRILRDPAVAGAVLADGGAVRMFEERYREFVCLPSARHGYGRLFRDLAVTGSRPALIHCATGKDRTGWAVASLLLLLGVPEATVIDEYLLGRAELEIAFRRELDAFSAAGGDPELLLPLIGVRRSYLMASLEAMRARHGTIEAYFSDGLGVDAATRRALREAFIDPDADSRARGS